MSTTPQPIRANSYLLAQDFFIEMLKGLREGRSVTLYVLEALKDEGEPIFFEMVVKRVGANRLPRTTQAMVAHAQKAGHA